MSTRPQQWLHIGRSIASAAFALFVLAGPARAHDPAKEVGFDQRLGASVPLDVHFFDDSGHRVALGDVIRNRPVILVMTYFQCPNLCTLVLNGLTSGLRNVSFNAGRQFDVVAVSIDPRDTPSLARQKKAAYVTRYGRSGKTGKRRDTPGKHGDTQGERGGTPGELGGKTDNASNGWHFLTGDQPDITRLAQAIGFRYFYDDQSRQYAHAAGIVVLTRTGRIARYLPGVVFPDQELRLALVEASSGRIGTLTDRLWLLCYHFDDTTGRYTLLVERILRAAAALVVLALATLIGFLILRERARKRGVTP
jgi:protein SCO1